MNERKRIVYLTFDFLQPIFSGNGTVSRIQVFGLLKLDYEVMVVCPATSETYQDREITKWVNQGFLHIIPVPIMTHKDLSPSCDWNGFFINGLASIEKIHHFHPHLIISPDWHTIDLAVEIKNKCSVPLITQFFRIFSYFREYFENTSSFDLIRQKELKMLSQSDLIITLSSFDKEWCEQYTDISIKIAYPPLSDLFINALSTSRKSVPNPESTQLITVSRIVPEKKIERVFPILEKLAILGLDFTYYLIGEALDQEYFEKVKKKIEMCDLKARIRIVGRVSLQDMIQYLRNSLIYIHTSSYEPFGITIIEALASGGTVVIDQNGLIGAKEVLDNSVISIDYNNVEQAALEIFRYISERTTKDTKPDVNIITKLNPNQYIENLVNLFRNFF